MKIDPPPINGSARQKLAWLAGVVLSLLMVLTLAGGSRLLRHDSQIAVHDTRIETIEKSLGRIEGKLDRLLELRP